MKSIDFIWNLIMGSLSKISKGFKTLGSNRITGHCEIRLSYPLNPVDKTLQANTES